VTMTLKLADLKAFVPRQVESESGGARDSQPPIACQHCFLFQVNWPKHHQAGLDLVWQAEDLASQIQTASELANHICILLGVPRTYKAISVEELVVGGR